MSTNKTKGAITEVKEQLFLDTADRVRLNVVTDNLGLDRPASGLSDDEWRAVAKEVALKRKIVRNAFYRVIEICLGPQKSRIGVLSEPVSIGDTELTLEDSSDLLQLGTLTLSPGLGVEETVEFCFRDLKTHKVQLVSPVVNDHSTVVSASSFLAADITASATSITLVDSATFPTTGFPYAVILGRGTELEETVSVTANDTGTNTLTTSATTFAHSAPSLATQRKPLQRDAAAGRTFIVLDVNDTRTFPNAGWLRINFGGGSEEIAEYIENDVDNNILYLKRPLENAHTAGESVELVDAGTTVETVSVLQNSVDWELFNTTPRNITILLPENLEGLSARSGSWLHKEAPALAGSTTTTAALSISDTEIPVTSVRGFVDEGDVVSINSGAEEAFYIRRDSGDPVEFSANSEPFTLADGQTLTVSVDGAAAATATFNIADFVDISNATAAEIAEVINTDVANCFADATSDGRVRITSDAHPDDTTASIEVTGGTANTEIGFLTPTLILSEGLEAAHGSGVAIDAVQVVYGGTTLEEGNIRDALGAVISNRFPGPYLYDPTQRGPSATVDALAETLPTPTRLVEAQGVGATCLEVRDLFNWPTPPFSPFTVRVGRNSGFQEDLTVTDITLAKDTVTTVETLTTVGATTISAADTTGFPESTGANPALYRIVVNKGRPNEETVVVTQNTAGTPGTFELNAPLVNVHEAGAPINLVNDVITTDPTTQTHLGDSITPTTEGHLVEKLINEITLDDASSFPNEGFVWLNFGKARLNVRKKIVTVVSDTILELESTDEFPTTDFNYAVTVSDGRPEEEKALVSANNTVSDRLTLTEPLKNYEFLPAAQVWSIDEPGGTPSYVDETTDFNDAGANDVDPFPLVTATIGDLLVIGFVNKFAKMTIEVGTAGTAEGDFDWVYWNDSVGWKPLSGVVDGTNKFETAGINDVSWTVPSDWDPTSINGSDSLFFIGAELTSVYTTTFPLLTQGFIHGTIFHKPDSYVTFTAGIPKTLKYSDKDTNTLELTTPSVLNSGHTDGETVMYSPVLSIPSSDGSDYAFLLPPNPAFCVESLIELIRGAGIQIQFITK